MPDERHRRPGRDVELEIVQHVRQLPVTEPNPLEMHVPGDSR